MGGEKTDWTEKIQEFQETSGWVGKLVTLELENTVTKIKQLNNRRQK